MKSLKYISWNVNGLRACMKKGFMQSFKELMQIASVCRKRNSSLTRSSLTSQAIISIGTVQ